MSYYTELISTNANIPLVDGVGCAVHEGADNLQMFGGVDTGTYNQYRQAHKSNPILWSSPITLDVAPCHLCILVYSTYYDRTFKVFGDQWSKLSQKEFWSIDGSGGDLQIHSSEAPWAGIGGYAWAHGKYIYACSGQTNAAFVYSDPTVFLVKLWRWSLDDGFELVRSNIALSSRGFSGPPSVVDGCAYMFNGGTFETWDYGSTYRNDAQWISPEGDVGTLIPRLPYTQRRFNSNFRWDGQFWDCFGYAGVDVTEIRRISDSGVVTVEANAVGSAAHAVGHWVLPDQVIFATGTPYNDDIRALRSTDIGGYHYNINYQGGLTAYWSGMFSHLDRVAEMLTGVEIQYVRIFSWGQRTYTPFILRELPGSSAPFLYDAVWVGSPVQHPGGGIWIDVACGVTLTPGNVYRQGQACNWQTGSDAFVLGGYNRAFKSGTVNANDIGLIFTRASDGTFPVSYKEA